MAASRLWGALQSAVLVDLFYCLLTAGKVARGRRGAFKKTCRRPLAQDLACASVVLASGPLPPPPVSGRG